MKKLTIALILLALPLSVGAFWFTDLFDGMKLGTTFNSLQLATDPDNGECLTTNGTANAWGSCGTISGGSGTISTSSVPTIGNLSYWTDWNKLGTVGTTSVSCAGSASCNPFTVIGSSPFTITGTDNTASTTLLADTNTWSGVNRFGNASSTYHSFLTASTTNLSFGGVLGDQWSDFCTAITGSADLCDGSDETGAGGSAAVSTSTSETMGRLAYWTTTSGTPARLGDIATTSLTINSPLTTSGTAGALVGGTNLTIDIDDIKAADLDLTDITLTDFTNDTNYITAAITGLKHTYGSTQTGATQTFATSSDTNIGLTITNGGSNIFTFTPTWISTLADGRIASAATWNAKADTSSAMTGTFDGVDFGNGTLAQNAIWVGGAAAIPSELTLGTAGTILASSGGTLAYIATTSIPLAGDVTGNLGATVVGNDTHEHTATTISGLGTDDISGLDISADTNLGATWPIVLSNDTLTFGGLSTTTALTIGHIPFVSGVNTFSSRATTTASCAGSVSCTAFDILGGSPITITGTDNTASTTLLADTNTWTGVNRFGLASSTYHSFLTASTTNLSFGGVLGNKWSDFCTAITGSADLCDGSDATGEGGGGGVGTVSTSTSPTIGGLAYWTSKDAWPEKLGTVATTSVSCSGTVSCDAFNVLGSSPITITGSGGSGTGNVATSTNETAGRLAYWTSNSGTPATLGEIATTTLTATTPLALSQPISVLGSSASVLSVSTTTTSLFSGIGGQILVYNDGRGWFPFSTSSIPLDGDVTGSIGATVVGNDSHTHNSTTISGLDISDDTDLTVTWPIKLTDDALSFDGISTSSAPTVSNLTYWTGVNKVGSVATSSVSCSGGTTCTNLIALGSSPSISSLPFPFTSTTLGNSTTTLLRFLGGASSTVFSSNWLKVGATASTTIDTAGNIFAQQASTTLLSALGAWFGSTATSTFTSSGWLGIGSSTPWAKLSINPVAGDTGPSFSIGSSTRRVFEVFPTFATSTLLLGTTTVLDANTVATFSAGQGTGTTTVNFGEVGKAGAATCFNVMTNTGAVNSFYFRAGAMVVEQNACR